MKGYYLILGLFLFISCGNDDNGNSEAEIEIKGKFTHNIPDCDTQEGTEENCEEYVDFLDSTNVSILLNGSDIVFTATYTIEERTVIINETPGIMEELTFEIISDVRLQRIEDGEYWVKE